MVGFALKFQGADDVSSPRRHPALDQPEQPLGVADDVREQPVHRPGFQPEGAFTQPADARHGGDGRVERRFVHRRHRSTQPGQHPGPAAGGGAEIQAFLARSRHPAQPRQCFPQLEIGAGRWPLSVLDEPRRAVDEGAGLGGRGQQSPVVQHRPAAQMPGRRRLGEGQRAGLHRRQPCLDQRCPAVVQRGQQRPIALDRAQRIRRRLDRRGGQQHRRGPAFQRPGGMDGRRVRQGQPAMPADCLAAPGQLGLQLGLETFGGKVGRGWRCIRTNCIHRLRVARAGRGGEARKSLGGHHIEASAHCPLGDVPPIACFAAKFMAGPYASPARHRAWWAEGFGCFASSPASIGRDL